MTEQCINCKHLTPISGGCKAYPDGIPLKFTEGPKEHNKVEKEQAGNFVFDEGEPEELLALKK